MVDDGALARFLIPAEYGAVPRHGYSRDRTTIGIVVRGVRQPGGNGVPIALYTPLTSITP